MTSALDGSEWPATSTGRFTPEERSPSYTLNRGLGGFHSQSGRCEAETNLLPLLGTEPWPGFLGILTLACRDLRHRFSWVCRSVRNLTMVPPKRDNASLKSCGHETSNEEINCLTLIQRRVNMSLIPSVPVFLFTFIINDSLCWNNFCQMFEFTGAVAIFCTFYSQGAVGTISMRILFSE
jgi:hypothetical protein